MTKIDALIEEFASEILFPVDRDAIPDDLVESAVSKFRSKKHTEVSDALVAEAVELFRG